MDHASLVTLRDRYPAWRLLASPHAPLVASFLHRAFVAPNVRVMSEADLAEALARAAWLDRCQLLYWGDIDTHGFAILDQLRGYFPSAAPFLMDRGTLVASSAGATPPSPVRTAATARPFSFFQRTR